MKLSTLKIRSIISNEIKTLMAEAIDHESIKLVVTGASKLLAAIESFNNDASIEMTNSVTSHISSLEKTLEDMVSNPGSYVTKERVRNVVTLKPVNQSDVL